MASVDYDEVIKTIRIVNEDGIWTSDESEQYILKNYDIHALPYGQVIHIWNVNPSGDEWNEYFVVFDGELMNINGDQYFRLHYSFTEKITDICAKYPEYVFAVDNLGCPLPKTLGSQEDFYQQMAGEIRVDDAYVKFVSGTTFPAKVWMDESLPAVWY